MTTATATAPAPASLSSSQKRLVLLAAIMGSFVAGLDATVVNVALPSVSNDLGGGLAGQQWVSNAYTLVLGSLILIGGSLGDVFGERRVFAIGVAGFGAVSVVCAVAPTIGVLIAGRALQGGFGALLTPSALAVIVANFPTDERGGAIGSWLAYSGIAMVIGPLTGGWLVDAASWRWIFAINVPFVLATLLIIARAVPARDATVGHRRVDWAGAALAAGGLAGPTFALIRQPQLGWGNAGVWGPLVAGVLLIAAFLVHERRSADPMLPLRLFGRRNFAVGNLETFTMYAGLGVVLFFLGLFLQQVVGYTALQAGLATIPTTLVMFVLSKRSGRLADQLGPRLFLGGGPLVSGLGILLMSRLGAHVDYWTDLLPGVVLFALGLSATVAPLTATVLGDAEESDAGIASGVNNAIARVASLLAVAALGAVIAARFGSIVDDRLASGPPLTGSAARAVQSAKHRTLAVARPRISPPQAERITDATRAAAVSSFHLGLGIGALLVAGGGVIGIVTLRSSRREVSCEDCAPRAPAGAAPPPIREEELPRVAVTVASSD